MAEDRNSKRYFWLKLNENFFEREEIKVIENMPNGKDYIIFYMKLLLKSVSTEGKLMFRDIIPYTPEMLSSITRTDIDTVRVATDLFIKLGLMELWDDGALFMVETQNMIGSETGWAKKKRIQRQKEDNVLPQKDNVPLLSTNCPTEKEIDIEKDIDIDIDKEQEQKEGSCSFKDDNFSKISIAFQQNGFGTMSLTVKEMLMALLDDYSAEWIIEAIKIAVKNNKRNLKYVEGILQNWRNQGGMKLETDKKTSTPPIKKTRFHMKEQRTDNYSNEELESVMERKRREARERMKGENGN